MSSPKCNTTAKKDLTIGIGKRLAAQKYKGVNALKKEMQAALAEKNARGRPRFLRLNKAAEKVLLKCVGQQKDDAKDTTQKAVAEFREILATKPKQLLSAYMKFSIEQGKTDALSKLKLAERAPKVKVAWAKLSEKKKTSYKPSAAERKKYEKARDKYAAAIKGFKTLN
jgi:hypothetical protein